MESTLGLTFTRTTGKELIVQVNGLGSVRILVDVAILESMIS